MAILTTRQIEQLRDIANGFINDIGSDIDVKTQTGTTYDINSGTTIPIYTEDTIKADIASFEKEELSSLILATDIKLMIKAEDIEKVNSDSLIIIDSVNYSVKDIMPEVKKNIKMYAYIQARK